MKYKEKLKWLCFCILGILCITGCSNNTGGRFESITYQDYQKLIENKESFVLEVMSSDCTHCQNLKPKLQKIIKEYGIVIKTINLEKLNSEDYQALTKTIGTRSTPTIIFYKEGYEASVSTRILGDVSTDKIVEKMKDNEIIK